MAYIARPAANQSAARSITCDEFKGVRSRSNRADHDGESSVAVNIGRDNAEFNRRDACSYTLPRDRFARTIIALGRELAEGRGERGAEEVDTHLVQLAGCRALQKKRHRQFVRRCIHGPTDMACLVIERFTEEIPTRGPFSLASSSICKNLTGLGWLRKSFKIRERCSVLGPRSWAGIASQN